MRRQALWRWQVAELNSDIMRHYQLVMIPGACDKKAARGATRNQPSIKHICKRGFPLQRTGSSVAARSPHRPRRRQRVGALSDRPPEAPGMTPSAWTERIRSWCANAAVASTIKTTRSVVRFIGLTFDHSCCGTQVLPRDGNADFSSSTRRLIFDDLQSPEMARLRPANWR